MPLPQPRPRRLAARTSSALWAVGLAALAASLPAAAFFEDLCISKRTGKLTECLEPASACLEKFGAPNRACPAQALEFATVPPGRSMIHTDATYFLAQALGYRADVAYWIAAYNEVTDYAVYAPIDQCGVQASSKNSGSQYITAAFNGFQRTNTTTDGPLYHYELAFSPNGAGTDVHGAGGVQAVYPFRYPAPGYPGKIDDVYQGTLYDERQWAMNPSTDAGLLCTAGLTTANGASHFSGGSCLAGAAINGTVPLLENFKAGITLALTSGPKVLDNKNGVVLYDQLGAWLADKSKTTGSLWLDPAKPAVPVQLARLGLYLHSLQDTASHSTFCGDDAPSPPGGNDPGTFMSLGTSGVQLTFGTYCATGPHLAGHVQETGTGDQPLPLRDYTALHLTLDELIVFGNGVAKANGWIVNPDLLPTDVTGERAASLRAALVGAIKSGQQWTRGEVYASGAVTRPLQVAKAQDRLAAMNAALLAWSQAAQASAPKGAAFTPLQLMPGNAAKPGDTSACFK